MTLADREHQRAHRNDPHPPDRHPKSKLWIWIVVIVAVLVALRRFFPPH